MDEFKNRGSEADPSRMRDDQPTLSAAREPWVGDHTEVPHRVRRSDEQRSLLIAELRALVGAGLYRVEPEAVAQAIIEESLGPAITDWSG